jgi:spore coat protein A
LSSTRRTFFRQAAALGLAWKSLVSNAQQGTPHSMGAMHQTARPTKPANNGSPMPFNAAPPPRPMLHVLELPPFVDALPLPERVHGSGGHGGPRKLRIHMREIHAKVHRDVPPTRMWSYGETALAPMIEAHANQPVQVEWVNDLPTKHFLPVDHSLHGCGRDRPEVRAIVHVHGARVPTKDDGHPDDWFVPGKSLTCTYPLQQDGTTLWYHDHAMGLNRLNVYAGLFGMFLVRDQAEAAVELPSGKYEVPLILYDRNYTDDGQLYYPTSTDPEHPWVSEFSGDAILINGKIRPYFEVEPRMYRFRVVNAANSRFFALSIFASEGTMQVGERRIPAMPTAQAFHQIGSDQGLLASAAELKFILLAPGERADLLMDFSGFAGQQVHLRTGALDILEFRVAPHFSPASRDTAVLALKRPLRTVERLPESSAVMTRTITLNEYQDQVGNSMVMLLNRKPWHDPVTERPKINTTEIWEFVNLTEDTHPMHLHLVRFQILDRRTFDVFANLTHKEMKFTGAPIVPEPNELGWKDVVQCPAGEITRIIVRFEGYAGDYLYHCHILEHEANDMMRPFEVVA